MARLSKLRCSFCKKSDAEVSKLVAGPRVHICDECVAVASRLMEAPPSPPPAPQHHSLSQRMAARIRRLLHAGNSHQVRSVPVS
jgi:ATP-dependent protease Clp ATPase subunit